MHRSSDFDTPGELSLVPDGLDPRPAPAPEDRGLRMAPGNRLAAYRFAEPFGDVIGVEVSADIVYLAPNPFSPVAVPIVTLVAGGAAALTLRMGRRGPAEPDPPAGPIPALAVLEVAGSAMQAGSLFLPPFGTGRTTRFRARWHTHGQAHLWHEDRLRAYEPGLAAGGSLTVEQIVIGIPSEVPRFFPRYLVRRVAVKLLQRERATRIIDAQIPVNLCGTAPDPCAEHLRQVQAAMQARVRTFMTGFAATGTRPWREGQAGGPFTPAADAAQAAAAGAARAFGDFLHGRPTEDAFQRRVGDLIGALAAVDPAAYAALVADLEELDASVDPECRRAFEPVLRTNEAVLAPIARLLSTSWALANGGSDA